jgi:hypothetical protein
MTSIWETCFFLDIGLSASACASWVQAWGTLGAIGAAILLATAESRRRRREDALAANIIADGVTLNLSVAMRKILELRDDIGRRLDDQIQFPLPIHADSIRALAWPTEMQILLLSRGYPDAATALVQAGATLAFIRETLESMEKWQGPLDAMRHQTILENLAPVVHGAFVRMERAWDGLPKKQ